MNQREQNKNATKTQFISSGASLLNIFIRPWVINKAMVALISVGLALPTFTYWQMFFISWTFAIICHTLGNIFYKKS